MKKYAIYIRVSTKKQGRSGLGLDAQRKMCSDFIVSHNGVATEEFVDVESGTHRDRRGLQDAINYCKMNDCALVIAKLDRLARDVEFCFKVVNTGIEIHFCDMPAINTLLLGVFASVAQYERELTSDRTKKALAVKKEQGFKLGSANPKYIMTMRNKSQKEKEKYNMEKGKLRTKRYLESRDQVAFAKVLRNVFPDYTQNEDMQQWMWPLINGRRDNCLAMLKLMSDYRELDMEGKLFSKWNFYDEDACVIKLRSYIQSFRKSVMK
jgi:DNA invertase Pin-like site-specific DNA recombinase